MALDHLEDGYVYHDDVATQIYDATSDAATAAYFSQHCIEWSAYGVKVTGCLNTDPLSLSLSVSLLGFKIAECTLSDANPKCKVGGSILGAKAELTLTFKSNPPALHIKGEVDAPIIGHHKFDITIPL